MASLSPSLSRHRLDDRLTETGYDEKGSALKQPEQTSIIANSIVRCDGEISQSPIQKNHQTLNRHFEHDLTYVENMKITVSQQMDGQINDAML